MRPYLNVQKAMRRSQSFANHLPLSLKASNISPKLVPTQGPSVPTQQVDYDFDTENNLVPSVPFAVIAGFPPMVTLMSLRLMDLFVKEEGRSVLLIWR